MFCPKCGNQIPDGSTFCPLCGAAINVQPRYTAAPAVAVNPDGSPKKSKVAAGILGILIGGLGVHNFYLGYIGKAIIQLSLYLVGVFLSFIFGFIFFPLAIFPIMMAWAPGIWGLIEGIMLLTGGIKVDGKGNTLKD